MDIQVNVTNPLPCKQALIKTEPDLLWQQKGSVLSYRFAIALLFYIY
jgi:hypothetical protein